MSERIDKVIRDYFSFQFIPAIEMWGRSVIETLHLLKNIKKATASVSYEFVRKRLERHVNDYELLIQETYDHIFEKAEELGIDLEVTPLIPPSIWLSVKGKVELKLDALVNSITSVLEQYTDEIAMAPKDVQETVKDLRAILSVNADQIWRLLNDLTRE
jgi:hypothetical protein